MRNYFKTKLKREDNNRKEKSSISNLKSIIKKKSYKLHAISFKFHPDNSQVVFERFQSFYRGKKILENYVVCVKGH